MLFKRNKLLNNLWPQQLKFTLPGHICIHLGFPECPCRLECNNYSRFRYVYWTNGSRLTDDGRLFPSLYFLYTIVQFSQSYNFACLLLLLLFYKYVQAYFHLITMYAVNKESVSRSVGRSVCLSVCLSVNYNHNVKT